MSKIAALFVQSNGVYNQPMFDVWGIERDARKYTGPYPVIAHPPCQRWGNYWFGSPSSSKRFKLGSDGGCFESALASVETYGGVLEHPAYSRAWSVFNIKHPPPVGGWITTRVGYTCCVEQGHYEHRARKKTWLYLVGDYIPFDLTWGPSEPFTAVEKLSKRERAATPPEFQKILIKLVQNEQ